MRKLEKEDIYIMIAKIFQILIVLVAIILTIIDVAAQNIALNVNRYDVNRDGKVTSTDYVLIKNYIMEE